MMGTREKRYVLYGGKDNIMQLSVIIPVYNAEKYLGRCLDSIVKQLCDEVELILVDDGSIDASSQICDSYVKKSACVKVFHQENSGVSAARNKGIEMACGEWITFVDADDCVSDCFVDVILEHISSDLDVILFGMEKVNTYHFAKKKSGMIGNPQYYDLSYRSMLIQDTFMSKSILDGCQLGMRSACAKVYRRSLLEENAIQFPLRNVRIGEDMIFSLMVYDCFRNMKCVPIGIYYYFKNLDSVINRYKPDMQEIMLSYSNAIGPWLLKHPQYKAYHAAYRLNDIILYIKYDFFHKENKEEWKSLQKRMTSILIDGMYKEYYKLAQENHLITKIYDIKKRIVFWLALHGHFRLLKCITHIRYGA